MNWTLPRILTVGLVLVALACGCTATQKYDGPRSLRLTSEPIGAAVTVDDKPVGHTPLTQEIEPAHNHTIEFSMPGRHTVRARVVRASNDLPRPGAGTVSNLYLSAASGPFAPLTFVLLSPLIGADLVYGGLYLTRSAEARALPTEVHAVLPLVEAGDKARVVDWVRPPAPEGDAATLVSGHAPGTTAPHGAIVGPPFRGRVEPAPGQAAPSIARASPSRGEHPARRTRLTP